MNDSHDSKTPPTNNPPYTRDFSAIKATKRVPDAPPQRVQPPLSKTEKVVVRLLLQGMTEREAAAEMGRSHNTVHVHTRNIYRKLGVASRGMLFQLIASDPELVEDEPEDRAAA